MKYEIDDDGAVFVVVIIYKHEFFFIEFRCLINSQLIAFNHFGICVKLAITKGSCQFRYKMLTFLLCRNVNNKF